MKANDTPRPGARPSGARCKVALAALLLPALLAGCALAPGTHLDYRTESAPLDELVAIEPITPGLVASYRSVISAGRPMSEELREALRNYDYRIGVGDILSVTVYGHPELTNPFGGDRSLAESGNRVQRDGTIAYPFIGAVEVAGRTAAEVREELAERLADFLTEPQIDVRVAAFESQRVYISGRVETPRALPITNVPLTIADAVSQAGGLESNANWHEARLNRNGESIPVSLYALLKEGDLSQNRLLQDGDVLHIPSVDNRTVAIMGSVRSPGSLGMGAERYSLTDAIGRAGGLNESSAEPTGVFVLRPTPGHASANGSEQLATVYQLNLRSATAFMVGSQFQLQPQDVVYVTTAPLARWNRVISLLLPSMDFPGDGVRMRDNLEELL